MRPEVTLEEVRAPKVSPFAVALTGSIERVGITGILPKPNGSQPPPTATGRFVVLYDPAGQSAWNGSFRVIAMVRADLDSTLGSEAMLGRVAWDWLEESLSDAGATHHTRAGTVTRVLSESFGSIDIRDDEAEIELRASWTPEDMNLAAHLEAWSQVLCTVAGLEPQIAGVSVLRRAAH